MSKVSIWLAPPFIHRRMQRFLFFVTSSAALFAWASPPQLGRMRPPPVTAAPLMKARRLRWDCVWVTCDSGSMVEPELAAVDEHPDDVFHGRVGLRLALDVAHDRFQFLRLRRTVQHCEVHPLDPLLPRLRRSQNLVRQV